MGAGFALGMTICTLIAVGLRSVRVLDRFGFQLGELVLTYFSLGLGLGFSIGFLSPLTERFAWRNPGFGALAGAITGLVLSGPMFANSSTVVRIIPGVIGGIVGGFVGAGTDDGSEQ